MFEVALVEHLQKVSIPDQRPAPAWITTTPKTFRPVTPACFNAEAQRQSLEPWRLLAVMKTENGRIGSFTLNTDGSYDIGPMQVNSVHLPELSKTFGVGQASLAQLLAYDGCFNVAIGAYLLRLRTNEANGDFWWGIGGYNSRNHLHSSKYILRVHKTMLDIVKPNGQKQ